MSAVTVQKIYKAHNLRYVCVKALEFCVIKRVARTLWFKAWVTPQITEFYC